MLDIVNNNAVWNFMKKHGLNIQSIVGAVWSATATGIQNRTYFSIPTPVPQAMEIYGFVYKAWMNIESSLVAASASAFAYAQAVAVLTYTQPQPPATNATTDASTSGNLLYRNQLFNIYKLASQGITQPATQNNQVDTNNNFIQGFVQLEKPQRIALSQLELYDNLYTLSGVAAAVGATEFDVLYKFVQVSDGEYNALVALATGQAVISEVIIA